MPLPTSSTTPVAIITGSAQRIGKALAIALHAEGYNLVLHYFQTSALELAQQFNNVRPHSATIIQADLNQPTAPDLIAQQALSIFGQVNVLINNASSFYPTPIGQSNAAQWDDLFNTNAKAPFFLSQALAPALQKTQGCIVNIADIYASTPKRNHTIYCMAKAANAMLTQSLALELAPHIRVNAIAPGAALWPANTAPADPSHVIKNIPLGRIGGTEAITDAALFLIKGASYITGQIISVDGGKTLAGIA